MSKLTKSSRFIPLLYQKFKYVTYKVLAAVLDPEVIEAEGRPALSLSLKRRGQSLPAACTVSFQNSRKFLRLVTRVRIKLYVNFMFSVY